MPQAAIALGSNLGTPAENLRTAIHNLGSLGRVTAVSPFHTTAPEINTNQPDFLNAALLLETALEPLALLRALLAIEQKMGRIRAGVPPKGPRLIDLDLIFYDAQIIDTPELQLPHPGVATRRFVLAPLAEIAPDWPHPVSALTVQQMLQSLPL